MPETEAHRRVASRIDAKIKQLEARGLLEVEILRAMAEHMPDFHHLMVTAPGPEMDTLCAEFTGFYEGRPGIMKNSPKTAYSSELKSEF